MTAPVICHRDPKVKLSYHMPDVSCAINFWKKRLVSPEILQKLDSSPQKDIAIDYPYITNVLCKVSHLLSDESLWENDLSWPGKKPMGTLEQKSIALIEGLVHLLFEAKTKLDMDLFGAPFTLQKLVYWIRSIAVSLDMRILFDVWRRRRQALWKGMHLRYEDRRQIRILIRT